MLYIKKNINNLKIKKDLYKSFIIISLKIIIEKNLFNIIFKPIFRLIIDFLFLTIKTSFLISSNFSYQKLNFINKNSNTYKLTIKKNL